MVGGQGSTHENASVGWQVRRASEVDADGLVDLRWSWRAGERGEVDMAREQFSGAFSAWLHEHHDSHMAFVAEAHGRVVGMAWLAIVDRVPGPGVWRRRAGNVQSVYVLADFKETGKVLEISLTSRHLPARVPEGTSR